MTTCIPRVGDVIAEGATRYEVTLVRHLDRKTAAYACDTGNPGHTISRYYPDSY